MTKSQFIKNLKDGDVVNDTFAVKFKKPPVEYKGKKGLWFELRASDRTGEISVKYWGDANAEKTESVYRGFEKGDIVHIRGVASEYRGSLQISVDASSGEIGKCAPGEYSLSDFVSKTQKDVEGMFKEVADIAGTIEKPYMRNLVLGFLEDENFSKEFKKCPAAMHHHQNYIGGLLEHTLNVVKICSLIHKIHPKLDRDFLIAGAVLHDIGKIGEFEVNTSIDISKEGMLLGHIVTGERMVREKIEKIDKFPETAKLKILHIMISHHGNMEYGSPKIPQFPEAVAVYQADELDAKVDYILRVKEEANTEDAWLWKKDLGHIYLE